MDFRDGIALAALPDGGMLRGRVGEQEALLVRRGAEVFAVSAFCTHYHGALDEGVVAGDTVRCPLHHACFSLRTGAALRPPAFDPLVRWRVERVGERLFVREPLPEPPRVAASPSRAPASVVIVGGGAAGLTAAMTLRNEGYAGEVILLSADDSAPYDRPNLSKEFLEGTAPEEWMPLRSPEFYARERINLRLNTTVTALDPQRRRVTLSDGSELAFGALLLATGAEPVRLAIPGALPAQLSYLRSFADSRAIVAKTATAKQVVILGASFIGLEVAAALRTRNIEVHVVGLDAVPMARVLGEDVGRFVRELHEAHGVRFHLGTSIARVDGRRAVLGDGAALEADFIVLGVGVRPAVALAQAAGLAVDRGVLVDEYLESSERGIFAAGDIARWPDARSGERIRVEHWVVAQRQGQTAACNILGRRLKFDAVPFFWSRYYGVSIKYLGHAERWDTLEIDGSLAAHDCEIRYRRGARVLAVATIGRNRENLAAELAMEAGSGPY